MKPFSLGIASLLVAVGINGAPVASNPVDRVTYEGGGSLSWGKRANPVDRVTYEGGGSLSWGKKRNTIVDSLEIE